MNGGKTYGGITLGGRRYSIRQLNEEDLDAILNVYKLCEDFLALGPDASASRSMVLADLEHSRQQGGIFCGIFEGLPGLPGTENLVGVLDFIACPTCPTQEKAFLELLMIAAPYRGLGLGAKVVHWLETKLRLDAGIRVIGSAVQVNNPSAIHFWHQMGYRITSGPTTQKDQTVTYALEKELV